MSKENHTSGNTLKALIVVALCVVVVAVMYIKQGDKKGETLTRTQSGITKIEQPGKISPHRASGLSAGTEENAQIKKPIPLLLDLGATNCMPCKMMAPILDELREEYRGRFDVVFIDVWEDKDALDRYKIRLIPTQIFFNAEGKELFRHQGFYSKKQILAKWDEFGINLEGSKGN